MSEWTTERRIRLLEAIMVCIEEHPIVGQWITEILDRKTEPSDSENPNNCEDEPTWEQVKEYCNKRCLDIVDSALRKKWYIAEPQTDCLECPDIGEYPECFDRIKYKECPRRKGE